MPYSDEDMKMALTAIWCGMSVTQAAELKNIPKKTLFFHAFKV